MANENEGKKMKKARRRGVMAYILREDLEKDLEDVELGRLGRFCRLGSLDRREARKVVFNENNFGYWW